MTAHTPIPFEPAQLRPRHDGWTAEKQIHFIEALAATKCVDEACRRVGMSDTSDYELRNRPCGRAFAKAWDIALDYQLDRVEQGAVERSINGVPRPIFYKGEQVGEWRHYDERLTMFLLRNRRPQRGSTRCRPRSRRRTTAASRSAARSATRSSKSQSPRLLGTAI